MKKIVRCSKLSISPDSKKVTIYYLLLLLAVIIFSNSIDRIIEYCIGIFIILIVIYDIFSLSKRVKSKLDVDKLLDDYSKSEYWSDKRYEEKYIKLKGIVNNIEFDKNKKTLKINLKGNDIYTLEGIASNTSEKCIKYMENISIGKEITIYGEFKREENQLLLDMMYLK